MAHLHRDNSTLSSISTQIEILDAGLTSPESEDSGNRRPSEHAVGLSDGAISQTRRNLLDLMNRLHSTGAQLDLDLPQIAVIGPQSAGKSSVIESISGIKLPRASGTCTRCPTECRMTHSLDPWACTISLCFMTDKSGTVQKMRVEPFGTPIEDAKYVEERLRRAQRAILNPSTDANHFLHGLDKDPESSELSFSSNYVSVQIRGPDVADLSFCDLPGLIASVARGGKQSDIKLVEDLVVSYISKPSCLILLTVACETDFETQGAHTLASQYDPDGKRTIGVLTKPDRIPSGEGQKWIGIIKNEEQPLELGWYCVKQPDSLQLKEGIAWSQARANETAFFDDNEPWFSLPYVDRQHLGTSNVVECLSENLSKLISRRIPQLQDELYRLLRQTQDRIYELPAKPSSDSLSEMLHLINGFSKDLTRDVEGVTDKKSLMQSIKSKQEFFKRSIHALTPNFRPYARSITCSLPPMDFLSKEEDDESDDSSQDREMIYIDDVMEKAQSARTRELPGYFPYAVTQEFIETAIKPWRTPSLVFFDAVNAVMVAHIREKIQKHFGRFKHSGLYEAVQKVVMEHIKTCRDQTRKQIDWLVRLEARPFTLNEHYLSDYKGKFLTYYKGCRHRQSNSSLMENMTFIENTTWTTAQRRATLQSQMQAVLTNVTSLGIVGTKPADLVKLLPPDPFETALEIMATVRAYYQVAYKRFVDYIPLAVDNDFARGVVQDVEAILFRDIVPERIDARERCRVLLNEAPAMSARREELEKKLERLEGAKQELMDLWG